MPDARDPLPQSAEKTEIPMAFRWNFRRTHTQVAKSLQVHPETVRRRITRLRETGEVLQWRLMINPELIHCRFAAVELEAGSSRAKDAIIADLAQIDGVAYFMNFQSRDLRVAFYYEDDGSLHRKLSLIHSICGARRSQAIFWTYLLPPCAMKLRNIDWKILAAVRKDPFRRAASIASEVRRTVRSVNRRLGAMTADCVGYLLPVRNIRTSKGLVCSFLIQGKIEENQIDDLVSQVSGRTELSLKFRPDLRGRTVTLNNLSVAEELLASMKNLGGVTRLKMNLVKEFIPVDAWLDEKLASMARVE